MKSAEEILKFYVDEYNDAVSDIRKFALNKVEVNMFRKAMEEYANQFKVSPRWIKASERLPEEKQKVFMRILDSNNNIHWCCLTYLGDNRYQREYPKDSFTIQPKNVIEWLDESETSSPSPVTVDIERTVKWISAETKPEYNRGVLVFIPEEDNHITAGMWDISNKWVLLDEYRKPECAITHWMEMPREPEGYKQEPLPEWATDAIREYAKNDPDFQAFKKKIEANRDSIMPENNKITSSSLANEENDEKLLKRAKVWRDKNGYRGDPDFKVLISMRELETIFIAGLLQEQTPTPELNERGYSELENDFKIFRELYRKEKDKVDELQNQLKQKEELLGWADSLKEEPVNFFLSNILRRCSEEEIIVLRDNLIERTPQLTNGGEDAIGLLEWVSRNYLCHGAEVWQDSYSDKEYTAKELYSLYLQSKQEL